MSPEIRPGGAAQDRPDPLRLTGAVRVVAGSELIQFGVAGLLRTIESLGPITRLTYADALALTGPLGLTVVAGSAEDVGPVAAHVRSSGGHTVVLLGSQPPKELRALLALGADGYVHLGDLTARHLATVLRQALAGKLPVPPELLRDVLVGDGPPAASARGNRPRGLTVREQETLVLLVEGLSNKQIATRLSISVHGVKRLVGNVLIKLNCDNRASAVRTAMVHNLVRATGSW